MNTFANILSAFSYFDLFAVTLLYVCWAVIGWVIEHPPKGKPSVSVLMKDYRRDWMRQFVTRESRIFDANILGTLREGTAFFASACMIAIGGGLALISNTERLNGVAEQLELAVAPALKWEIKIVVALILVINGFLRFVWAHRLFGYCAVLIAAVPNDPKDPRSMTRALQAAEVNISAARSFNSGLRCVYFALAALAWLGGAALLTLAVLLVLFITWRREFISRSRRAILHDMA